MTSRFLRGTPLILAAVLILAACNYPTAPSPSTADAGDLRTQAAVTVYARMTEVAQGTSVFPTIPVEATPVPEATNTSAPAITSTSASTATTVPPTATTAPTATPVPCNLASFDKDVTVPDNTSFAPGAAFTKTWRLKNAGTCTWSTSYTLVFASGDQMGGAAANLPQNVAPGQTVDVSVNLTAPNSPGTYKGNWMLADSQGKQFGIGPEAKDTFWVQIKVSQPTSGVIYNFADNYCSANWFGGKGQLSAGLTATAPQKLPCPGKGNEASGFVLHLSDPNLENRKENESTIWTQPQDANDGWIAGVFPRIPIKAGDRFLADVGCLANHPACDVTFQLNYRLGTDELKSLGDFHEVYDGKITRIDIDLTPLTDNAVEFVLTVLANGSGGDDAAFWLMPHIVRP